MVACQALYNLLADIAAVSTLHTARELRIEGKEVTFLFEVIPHHIEYQLTIYLKAVLSYRNTFSY